MPILIAAVTVLGLCVGSFANVVIHRVPQKVSVVSPPSRCPGCEHEIRPRDNVPILSWLMLRGRCRDCQRSIPFRYPAVEAVTAVLCSAIALRIGLDPILPLFLYLGVVGAMLACIDADTGRLPDSIVLPSWAVSAVLVAIAAGIDGELSPAVRALAGAGAMGLGYLALGLAWPGGMGLGDIKLAPVLGLGLGWLGWPSVVIGAFAPFLLGALAVAPSMRRKRGQGSTAIAFGPFMIAGFLLAVFAANPIWSVYRSWTGL
ncbi:MAG: peptidase domain protein [Pseudonocardiales bacterium]|nr:peptidase domain protein [Pseudonocardiales bacterium]